MGYDSDFYGGMKVVVLGGAGMIGSQLCELLIDAGAKVTAIDDLSRGRRGNLNGLDLAVVRMDVINHLVQSFLYGSDCVFNLAAKVTGMHYNRGHHASMFYYNMLTEAVPLMLAAEMRVPYFLQCSTVCVYPRDMEFPVMEEEGHRSEPESTNAGYGWAKRMGERMAGWVAAEYPDTQVAITRFSNCFGPRDYFGEKTSHVIPALIRRTLSKEPTIKVYGTGSQIREFLYSRDAALGCMKVMEMGTGSGPVNIGNPKNRISMRNLANLIQEVCGVKKPLSFDESIEDGYPRRGSDITKLVALTAWQPTTSLKIGLIKAVEWYRENKEVAEKE